MENGVIDKEGDENAPVKGQAVDVSVLVQWRDAAEESSYEARQLSERDRDYYDNKQLTAAEEKALKKRGQPPTIFNRIKRKINYLGGLEKRQRAMPKAMPRNPVDEDDASAVTDCLRYVVDDQNYAAIRSMIWKNICIEGAGGIEIAVEMKQYGPCITLKRINWDRMFWDPHSSEADFSDAMYKGIDVWMDEDDALHQYKNTPGIKEILQAAYKSAPKGDTYEDKPKNGVWADRKRRRIRVSQMYFKASGVWYYAEFTHGGLLKGDVSPYLDEDGEPSCAFEFQSAYVDRDNNRYGEARELISPQDAFNKRHSKLLHRTSSRQIRYDPSLGGVDDIEKVRKELSKPDGVVEAAKDGLEIIPQSDQSAAEFQLLSFTGQELDAIGANSALLGEQGGAPSGKAIQLNQTGGMVELGDLFDGLRHLDVRVFRQIWNRIRQFWTEEKWVRVTDDERTIRFVGYNVDPMKQMMMQAQSGGQMPENISVMDRNPGEMDVDIIIEDAPDGITPQVEQFNALVQFKQADPDSIPSDVLIELMPGVKTSVKKRIIEHNEKRMQPDPMQQQLQMAGAEEEIKKLASESFKNQTQGQLNLAKAQQSEADAFANLLVAMNPPEPAREQIPQY